MAAKVVTLPWSGEQWPGRIVHGLPTFGFRDAPSGLATRRQLRARGLCPGGHEYVAQLVWRRGKRWAALYRLDLAKPSRGATTAQLAALRRADRVLRTCTACRRVWDFRLPASTGRVCWPCTLSEEQSSYYQEETSMSTPTILTDPGTGTDPNNDQREATRTRHSLLCSRLEVCPMAKWCPNTQSGTCDSGEGCTAC